MRIRGPIAFDYSNDDGIYRIGTGASLFEIKFSSARDDCIRILRDPASIDAVALADGAIEITHVKDAARFDYSSRDRIPKEGQVAILRNAHGLYAALKIRDVKNAFHGDAFNEVTFEYLILDDGSRDFSDVADIEAVDASFSKRVLLTGAGFSRNWGGLLATEVSGRILAHHAVMARPRVRDLILREPSFEDALETTRTGLYEAADAQAMELAIKAAFDDMDAAYKNPNPPVLSATINDFIGRFCPGAVSIGTGYVFSLNQDLLIERIYGTIPTRQQLTAPGINWLGRVPPFPAGAEDIPLASLLDPAMNEPQLLRAFNYVKLHGSINWRSSDGSSAIVMGLRKPLTITRSPLIGWYHRVFERVLSAGDVRLMVIGYGWGDNHINTAIADAVQNHNLRVYFWDQSQPRDILNGRHRGDDILPGTMGFMTRPMAEVMPPSPMSPGSADYDSLLRGFF